MAVGHTLAHPRYWLVSQYALGRHAIGFSSQYAVAAHAWGDESPSKSFFE